MRRCVLGCPKGITLHRFPEDEEKRKQWLRIINMENCPLNNLYLCTRHFTRRMKGKTRVIWNAVPTRNLLGVDASDIDSEDDDDEEDDEPVEVAAPSPPPTQSPLKKSGTFFISPSELKSVDNKGKKLHSDQLNEPTVDKNEKQFVKYVKIVDGKAINIASPKAITTKNKDSAQTKQTLSASSISKRLTRSVTSKTTAAEILKDKIKIGLGKPYKFNKPTTTTNVSIASDKNHKHSASPTPSTSKNDGCDSLTKSKTKQATLSKKVPTLLKCKSESFLFNKSEEDQPPASTGFEDLENIEDAENQENVTVIEELVDEYEVLPIGEDYEDSYKQADEVYELKENEDSNQILDAYNEGQQAQVSASIDKDQPVKFGNRIRPRPRQKCGFFECFTNNNTFCLTCFFCGAEFEVWDWQQFIEHLNEEHIPERKPITNNNKRKWEDVITEEEEKKIQAPKLEEVEELEENSEMVFQKELDHVLNDNTEHFVQDEDSIQTYDDDTALDEMEFCDEEDWQVDKLDEYEDIQIYEDQGSSNTGDVEIDVDDAEVDRDYEVDGEGDVPGEGYEEDEEEEDNRNEDDDNIGQAVINILTTDQTRVLAFLKQLRKQPLLWHPRRYGPPIYDDEMKKFLKEFDESMSTIDFRRSIEHLRHQYKRFTPLTSRGRAKLQQEPYLRECIQIIKEVADKLSKPFAFHCDVCRFCFLDENRMFTHRYLKHKIGNLQYICSCGVRFEFERQKEEHEEQHKLNPRFTCNLCGQNFIFNRLLRDHMNESHPETQKNPLPYPCRKCDERFPSIIKRAHHMARHRIPKFHCELCNQSYKTSFRFQHHMKRHQDQRDWVCEHCGKAFVEKRSLNAHLFRVHRDGGLKCVYCRTYFASQDSLDAHNKKFHPDGSNLDRMKNIRKFFNSKYKHKNGEPQYKNNFRCKECGETFLNCWALVGHKRQTGHDLQVFNCPHCQAVLSSPKTLMGHLRRIHKLPIASMADLRKELLQTAEQEQLSAGEEEVEPGIEVDAETDTGLKLEEFEIFEAYEIE